MGRNTDKGKGKASTSSGREAQAKRQWMQEEQANVPAPTMKPTWRGGGLSAYAREWQAELFIDKMATLRNRMEGFMCEKEVTDPGFKVFGVVKKFEDLGWEAALHCYDEETNTLYDREIEEWVSTLRCPPFKKGYDMKLIGTVRGQEVVMSFDELNQIALFDTKPSNSYEYPSEKELFTNPDKQSSWYRILEAVLQGSRPSGSQIKRAELKMTAKLLMSICLHNVVPRRGDISVVKNSDIPILFALMTGRPRISFRYLVMLNIWSSRDSNKRKLIPHCRLIQALLKHHGVITEDSVGMTRAFKGFRLGDLAGWEYKITERHHELISDNVRWRVIREDVEMEEGEQEEEVEEMVQPDYMDVGDGSGTQPGGWDYSGGYESYGHNWAHEGSINEVVERHRPSTYEGWSNESQSLFDHQTFMGAYAERAEKERFDRMEMWSRANAYGREHEINMRYMDDRNRRMHDQWHAGEPVVPSPPAVDYTTLPPFDGSVRYPEPPLHHSMWVDPMLNMAPPPTQQGEGSSGDDGAFNFGQFSDFMSSIFGPPQPPYH